MAIDSPEIQTEIQIRDKVEEPTPIDGKWSSFDGNWTQCIENICGTDWEKKEYQTRTCAPPKYGGKNCEGSRYDVRFKPIDGGWSKWLPLAEDEWFQCTQEICGDNFLLKEYKKRTCTNPEPAHNGKPCVKGGEEVIEFFNEDETEVKIRYNIKRISGTVLICIILFILIIYLTLL